MARWTSTAVTEESTPPDRAQMTWPSPTCCRMFSVAVSMKEAMVHRGLSLQMRNRKLLRISLPRGVWCTSG